MSAPGRRPRLLDLFCCAGGAGEGYRLAGFDVVGVDIDDQPNNPHEFIQADALVYATKHAHEFDAIHASPPCQAWSPLNNINRKTYPMLIGPIREILQASGRPYVIENVAAARRELRDPVLLCGAMFNLNMYRHRLFETTFTVVTPPHSQHVHRCTRNGYLPSAASPFLTITGGRHSRAWRERAAAEMGIPWAKTTREVCEAIPPAYTLHLGRQLMKHVISELGHG